MEQKLEQIQKQQNMLIENYFKEQSPAKKEEIRAKLFMLCNEYIELSKKLNLKD